MGTELTAALEREIAELENALAQDPRVLRLEKLREFLAAERLEAARTSPRRPTRNKEEKTTLLLDLVRRLARDKGGPIPIGVIMREANDAQIVVGKGRKAANRVSATLSHHKFRSFKRDGWMPPEDETTPKNTETADPGLEDRESAASADRHLASGGTTAQGREAGPGGGI